MASSCSYSKDSTDSILDPDGVVNTAESFIVTAPHLTKLWGFKCPMTQGRPVTCIAWNPSNKVINDAHINTALYNSI